MYLHGIPIQFPGPNTLSFVLSPFHSFLHTFPYIALLTLSLPPFSLSFLFWYAMYILSTLSESTLTHLVIYTTLLQKHNSPLSSPYSCSTHFHTLDVSTCQSMHIHHCQFSLLPLPCTAFIFSRVEIAHLKLPFPIQFPSIQPVHVSSPHCNPIFPITF